MDAPPTLDDADPTDLPSPAEPPRRWKDFPALPRPRGKSAIVAFVKAYFLPVAARFLLLTRDEDMTEELTQDFFVDLLQKLDTIAPSADMRKIADELCRVVFRTHTRRLVVRRGREAAADMSFEGNHGHTRASADLASDRSLLQAAKGALDRMSEDMCTAVLLRHCLEMTIPEI